MDLSAIDNIDLICERCGATLTPQTVAWLELNSRTGEYAVPGTTEWSDGPDSQGCFPFGKDCAEKVVRRQ